jgi:cytoskeletal protein CcmA (bactofilin family)
MALLPRSVPLDPPELRRNRQKVELDFGDIRAFLGEGIRFNGEVRFAGAVRIDGHLEGKLVYGEVLIIGEHAQVKAEIAVGSVEISGQVEGSIIARQRVELRRGSCVAGRIRTLCLVIFDGAVFDGKCEMLSPEEGPGDGF